MYSTVLAMSKQLKELTQDIILRQAASGVIKKAELGEELMINIKFISCIWIFMFNLKFFRAFAKRLPLCLLTLIPTAPKVY